MLGGPQPQERGAGGPGDAGLPYFEALGLLASLGRVLLPQLLLHAAYCTPAGCPAPSGAQAGELSSAAAQPVAAELQLPRGLMLPQQQRTSSPSVSVSCSSPEAKEAQGPESEFGHGSQCQGNKSPRTSWQELTVGR